MSAMRGEEWREAERLRGLYADEAVARNRVAQRAIDARERVDNGQHGDRAVGPVTQCRVQSIKHDSG